MTHERPRTQWRQVAGPDLDPRSFAAATVPDGPHSWEGGEHQRLEAKNRAALVAHFAKPVTAKASAIAPSTCAATGGELARGGSADRPDLEIPADLSIPAFVRRAP
jgi:hypothetical protein